MADENLTFIQSELAFNLSLNSTSRTALRFADDTQSHVLIVLVFFLLLAIVVHVLALSGWGRKKRESRRFTGENPSWIFKNQPGSTNGFGEFHKFF